MGKVADRRNSLLAVLAENPGGLPVESLVRRAGERSDRRKLLSALRHLAKGGQVRIERQHQRYGSDVSPPRVRPAVTQ